MPIANASQPETKLACLIQQEKRQGHHRYSLWRQHLDEVFVKINAEMFYLWRVVDQEGEVLEVLAREHRDRKAALKFLKRTIKRYRRHWAIVTDQLTA